MSPPKKYFLVTPKHPVKLPYLYLWFSVRLIYVICLLYLISVYRLESLNLRAIEKCILSIRSMNVPIPLLLCQPISPADLSDYLAVYIYSV